MPDADDLPDYDQYNNAEICLPYNGEYLQSTQLARRELLMTKVFSLVILMSICCLILVSMS